MNNGVCGLAFDRATIPMNKFVVTTLEAQFHVFDARTFNEKTGARSAAHPRFQIQGAAAVRMPLEGGGE